VDATVLTDRPTGAARVVRGLLSALSTADPELSVVALAREGTPPPPDVATWTVAPRRGLGWELRGAAAAARAAEADLLFTVRELVGPRNPPTVLHVFEPPAYRIRRSVGRNAAKDALLAAVFPRSLRRAAAVTAGSATTASWLRDRYGVDAEVVLPGIDAEFFEPGRAAERRRPYLLHIAGADPRDATDLLDRALRQLGREAPCVVVAGGGGSSLSSASVERVGWVDDDELRALYRGALALVHLARYEAYGGLPALEAMALGTPVVALRAPGVTEALEGAALLVDRPDPASLAHALANVVRDAALRRELAAEGRVRVEPLRWERAATQFAAVFRRALSAP
jgi:glycosyltransferase involved in cell wall biosynthesis